MNDCHVNHCHVNELAWSIVIPTFRRPEALSEAVAACLAMQRPSGGLEIVIVDDGGGEVPAELLRHPDVRLLEQANAGPAAARNRGARMARGRRLAFVDDDCRPEVRWLLEFDEALTRLPSAMAGGHTTNGLVGSTWSAASQDLVDALYRRANGSSEGPRFFTSNNIALPRDGFLELGGFDESFRSAGGEDRAFCHAWRARDRMMVDVPSAIVYHYHAMDVCGFWRQHFAYGRGARRFYELVDQGEFRRRGVMAAAALAFGIVLQPLRSTHSGRRLRRAFALMLAQGATIAGNFAESRSNRR